MDQASYSLLGLYFDNCLPGAQYMASTWAGLPGFLFTLPLSVLVVTGYFLAAYAKEAQGYNITVTSNHTEYGFLICAFLNGFVFYPGYHHHRLRTSRHNLVVRVGETPAIRLVTSANVQPATPSTIRSGKSASRSPATGCL